METKSWLKLLAVAFNLLFAALLLSYCSSPVLRVREPARIPSVSPPPKIAPTAVAIAPASEPLPKNEPATAEEFAAALIDEQARRDELRRAQQRRLKLERNGRTIADEAALASQGTVDWPEALQALLEETRRYTAKRPELKRLKQEERWQREEPVKEALTQAKSIAAAFYQRDKELQRQRDTATLYKKEDREALKKLIAAFTAGKNNAVDLVDALIAMIGRIPESELLAALDILAKKTLPKDAFDLCRANCGLKESQATSAVTTYAAVAPHDDELCADRATLQGRCLPLRSGPGPFNRSIRCLPEDSCGLVPTGTRRVVPDFNTGSALWIEVIDDRGNQGWVSDFYVTEKQS